MRRAIPRLRTSLLIVSPPTPRLTLSPLAQTASTTVRTYAEGRLERLRKKIWGSDAPPGAKDPYARIEPKSGPAIDRTNYVPAVDARSLPIVGVARPLGIWEVDSFAPLTPVARDAETIHRAIHCAVVEVYTLHLNGRDPTEELSYTPPINHLTNATDNVLISVSESGEARFEYASAEAEEQVLNSVLLSLEDAEPVDVDKLAEEGAVEAEAKAVEMEEAAPVEEVVVEEVKPVELARPGWLDEGLAGEGWVNLPLNNDALKFAIAKRTYQLTGHKIPDATASLATTVADIIKPLITPPKPKKLVDELVQTELAELPNVKIFNSRVRPLDKERVIGRATRIEEVVDHRYEGVDVPDKAWKGHVTWN